MYVYINTVVVSLSETSARQTTNATESEDPMCEQSVITANIEWALSRVLILPFYPQADKLEMCQKYVI